MKVVVINISDPKDFKEVILSYEFINARSAYITGETSTEENTERWLRILVYQYLKEQKDCRHDKTESRFGFWLTWVGNYG